MIKFGNYLNDVLVHHGGVGVEVSARRQHEHVVARRVGALVVPFDCKLDEKMLRCVANTK